MVSSRSWLGLAILVPAIASSKIGPTFGTGHIPGLGQFCRASESSSLDTVVLNHTVSPGSTHAVLHHFWATGWSPPSLSSTRFDRIWVSYYLDGELEPSISFQPSMACGVAFPELYDQEQLFSAGGHCGKSSAVGGFWHTFPIPFTKSAIVTVRPDMQDGDCVGGYLSVRGTENLPLALPEAGIPLPKTARLSLQRNDWAIRQPIEYVKLFEVEAGLSGLVFMTSFAVEAEPVGGADKGGGYIEGCWQFYPEAAAPFPGVVVGTGVEDYFDSAFYFGADTSLHKGMPFSNAESGLTFFDRTDTTERLSAYRFHTSDPLVFTDGGRLVWRVGAAANEGPKTKCGQPYPSEWSVVDKPGIVAAPHVGRETSAVNMTSYVWVFTWRDEDEAVV